MPRGKDPRIPDAVLDQLLTRSRHLIPAIEGLATFSSREEPR
jgi:hypothetical protein